LVPPGGSSPVDAVAEKATLVADNIGGADGFGGPMMTGYLDHAPPQMGFLLDEDLAAAAAVVSVALRNDSTQEASFRVTYFASHMGLQDEVTEVVVAAGTEETVELPCAEIVGMGDMGMAGEAACLLATGVEVPNTYAVPVFLHMDFECGETREFVLSPDVDDLDADGDVEELIVVSDGYRGHVQNGGPMGHTHGVGMMGTHVPGPPMFAP
jgi:hypothetical protein